MHDSKSCGASHEGSSPSSGTIERSEIVPEEAQLLCSKAEQKEHGLEAVSRKFGSALREPNYPKRVLNV